MHELSLAENILQLIEDAAAAQPFHRVKTVWLEIGQLACVEQESLRFFFAVVTEDSIARQAKLEIIGIAGQAVCQECHRTFPVAAYHETCPHCGCSALQITQGEEMRIRELEVE